MDYKCPSCNMEYHEAGECDSCGVDLEAICPNCGETESDCSCSDEVDR